MHYEQEDLEVVDDDIVDMILEFEDEVEGVKADNGGHREAQVVGGLGF